MSSPERYKLLTLLDINELHSMDIIYETHYKNLYYHLYAKNADQFIEKILYKSLRKEIKLYDIYFMLNCSTKDKKHILEPCKHCDKICFICKKEIKVFLGSVQKHFELHNIEDIDIKILIMYVKSRLEIKVQLR
jgi:hypothetical protein